MPGVDMAAQMGGGDSPSQQQSQSPDSGSRMNDQVRQLIMQIGQLAQGAPEAQAEFQAAAKALTAASLKLVAGQQQQPTGQPMVGS